MIKEAIILAGGLGTRLKSKVSELPKSMALINGLPFLEYQLDFLSQYNIQRVCLAVGYLSNNITDYFGDHYKGIDLVYSIEKKPLGTGGAISKALSLTNTEEVLILNGDTMFQVDLLEFYSNHQESKADLSIALKPMSNFERYGVVKLNPLKRVVGFEEKQFQAEGNINGGVYILNKKSLSPYSTAETYSFEKKFLEIKFNELYFNGFISNNYFIDIGVPVDYDKAQEDFKQYASWSINKKWTLFLDRDGVINKQIKDGYVTNKNTFEFIDGVLESIPKLNSIFNRIIIVTNQQCVAKGIINEKQLNEIHSFMISEIEKHGGKIDAVYFAPQLDSEKSKMRKPNIGMGESAKNQFVDIDFQKSIMVGDSLSDIEFGKRLEMKTVYINPGIYKGAHRNFKNLESFTKSIS